VIEGSELLHTGAGTSSTGGYVHLYGPTGENTLNAKNNYAIVLEDQEKWEDAERMFMEVIEGQTAALGADHAETLMTKGNYAGVLQASTSQQLRRSLPRVTATAFLKVTSSSAAIGASGAPGGF